MSSLSLTAEPSGAPTTPAVEQRRAERFPILQRCIVRIPGVANGEGWRCIGHNISATGIAVTMPVPLAKGTELVIEPWDLRGAPVLRAHVVYAKRVEFLWSCGCELTQRLTDSQLHAWLAGPIDWLDRS